MEALTVRVGKAVHNHIERLEAVDRCLRWLPHEPERPKALRLSESTVKKILSGRAAPPPSSATSGPLKEHWAIHRRGYFHDTFDHGTPAEQVMYATMACIMEEYALTAEPTTFVSSDMIDMLSIAAEEFDGEKLHASDMFAPSGIVYLEKPLVTAVTTTNVNEETGEFYKNPEAEVVGIRAVSWARSDQVMTKDPDGTLRPIDGMFMYLYTDAGCFRYITGVGEQIDDLIPDTSLMLLDSTAWAYGSAWRTAREEDTAEQIIRLADSADGTICSEDSGMVRRFMVALFRFVWQELLVRDTPEEVNRATRRQAQRLTGLKEPITILKLRRARHASDGTGEGCRLDHRVLVRGHARNQWYPSLGPSDDPDAHRLIWIAPHVRGPEDAPFLTKPKATAIVR